MVTDSTLLMRTMAQKNDVPVGAWRKRWLVFNRNGASFVRSGEVRLDMPCFRCPKEGQYVVHLSTLVSLLDSAGDLTNQVNVITVFDLPYDFLSFLENLGRWRRDCDFER